MLTEVEGITKTPGLCGGDACIEGHRIPVWGLVRMRQLGATDSSILESYPSITASDITAAWEYYANHRDEIEQSIEENEKGEEGFFES